MCAKFHGFMGQTKNKKPTKTTTEKNPTTIKKKTTTNNEQTKTLRKSLRNIIFSI